MNIQNHPIADLIAEAVRRATEGCEGIDPAGACCDPDGADLPMADWCDRCVLGSLASSYRDAQRSLLHKWTMTRVSVKALADRAFDLTETLNSLAAAITEEMETARAASTHR